MILLTEGIVLTPFTEWVVKSIIVALVLAIVWLVRVNYLQKKDTEKKEEINPAPNIYEIMADTNRKLDSLIAKVANLEGFLGNGELKFKYQEKEIEAIKDELKQWKSQVNEEIKEIESHIADNQQTCAVNQQNHSK